MRFCSMKLADESRAKTQKALKQRVLQRNVQHKLEIDQPVNTPEVPKSIGCRSGLALMCLQSITNNLASSFFSFSFSFLSRFHSFIVRAPRFKRFRFRFAPNYEISVNTLQSQTTKTAQITILRFHNKPTLIYFDQF